MSEEMEKELEWYKEFLEIADNKILLDNLPELKPKIEKIKDYVLLLEYIKEEEERLLKTLNLKDEDLKHAREMIKEMLTRREKLQKELKNNMN